TRTHGLHVANLAIAKHGNERKPAGVNPISNVRLVRYSNSTGDTQWNFALGYQIYSEVCGRGSEVASLSLGAATPEGWRDKWEKLCKHYFMALKQAARTCRHCRGDSFLLVTAAGNEDGLSMNWEPSAENVLVVGAYDPFHSRIVPYSNRGLHVDLYVSGFSDGQRDGLFPAFRTDGTEELMQGTSFACPVASGLATLAWEIPRDPPLKGSEVKQLLLCSAAVDGAGNRVLDASAAVRAAASNGVSTYELTESSPATGGHTFKLEGTACPPVDNRRGWYTFQQSGSGADYYMSANWWNTAGVPYMEFLHSYNLGWYDEPDTEEDERVWNWYLRGPIVAGTHWSAIGRSNDFTIRSDSRIETIAAKVIVPAGEYEACVKVVETMTVPAGYAAVAGNYWVTKYERWLKAGVGWVQVRAHRSDGKVAQGQLLAFHSAGGGSTFFPVATGTRWKFRWETLDR
ncbi:MAG: S8/S53 family peptidase, partial [Candidatus Riflebacteria bacterium]|nr:S8/S53 family peptidase [Candidatus Riflebacteria bacterium]